MKIREAIAPSYLPRIEQIARGLVAVGASSLAIAGGLGIEASVDGHKANKKADTAASYEAQAQASAEAADSFDNSVNLFLIAGSGGILAVIGGGIQERRATGRLRRLEEYQRTISRTNKHHTRY